MQFEIFNSLVVFISHHFNKKHSYVIQIYSICTKNVSSDSYLYPILKCFVAIHKNPIKIINGIFCGLHNGGEKQKIDGIKLKLPLTISPKLIKNHNW